MDRIIEVKVNGSHVTKDNRNAGVRGEANSKSLRIEFDAGWDGYAKSVTFWNALGLNPVRIELTANLLENAARSTRAYLCPIPGEAMEEAGLLVFVIDGAVNGKKTRSVPDNLFVTDAPTAENAGIPAEPTPNQWEQMQAQYESILATIGDAALSAEEAEESAYNAERLSKVAETAANRAYEAFTATEAVRIDTAGLVSEAQQWAERAQAEAERATVPAVEGVYNVVLQDRATGEKYALIVQSGVLALLGVDYDTVTEKPVLIDSTTGVAYEVIVENAVLKIVEV